MIEDAAMHEAYVRVITPEHSPSEETEDVCFMLQEAMELRQASCSQGQARPSDGCCSAASYD